MTRAELEDRLSVIRSLSVQATDNRLDEMARRIVEGVSYEAGQRTHVRQLAYVVCHHVSGSIRGDLSRADTAVLNACVTWLWRNV